jgi:hypothetical protein
LTIFEHQKQTNCFEKPVQLLGFNTKAAGSEEEYIRGLQRSTALRQIKEKVLTIFTG